MRIPTALAGLVLPVVLTGCAAFVTGIGDERVQIDSSPAGAAVFVDGTPQATTPTRVMLNRKHEHVVRVELAGYAPFQGKIEPGFNHWIWGDFAWIGLAPVAFLFDVCSGAVVTLYPGDLKVTLMPVAAPPR